MLEHGIQMQQVLDHGYVLYIDSMGTDITPAESARMSYGAKGRGWDNGDGKLIKRLLRDGHTSPFEFNEIAFEIQAPIFVARQMVRHRTANWSEFSMRYADASKLSSDDILFYTPTEWRRAHPQLELFGPTTDSGTVSQDYAFAMRNCIETYKGLVAQGVSNELARLVLPASVYTRWRWKMDYHNLMKFLKLRQASDAQWETQRYANAIAKVTSQVWPRLMELSENN